MQKFIYAALAFCACFIGTSFAANNIDTIKTTQYFDKIKTSPTELYMFLREMPKGGELHNHLSGSTYAENLIKYAKNSDNYLSKKDSSLIQDKSIAFSPNEIGTDIWKLSKVIKEWSMMDFVKDNNESAHDHFFKTFYKFGSIPDQYIGETLAEVATRAADQNIDYLELIILLDVGKLFAVGDSITFTDDFDAMAKNAKEKGLDQIENQFPDEITKAEKRKDEILHCKTAVESAGCNVKIRYQIAALRAVKPTQTFVQLLSAFDEAKKDPRIVGVNIVQAEDDPMSIQNYDLHMNMFGYFAKRFPEVHRSLHAGELTLGLVPPEYLKNHIRKAIEIAHAERIGHGTDIAYENNAYQLLKEMDFKHIPVEICLTSNDKILGVKGNEHPIQLYVNHSVPVTINTDDEGVLRTDLTQEYRRAELDYQFPYAILKQFARNSISYSFLPGESLWVDNDDLIPVRSCAKEILGSKSPTESCFAFLKTSEKARQQWKLESDFIKFEAKMSIR